MLIRNEKQMRAFGARLISACSSGGIITLHGNLGAGKTTLVRGALESLGITSGVRSPTYTLIEYYPLEPLSIAHFDLYRLGEAEELEYIGFRDYLNDKTLCFIEWPERAEGILGDIGLQVNLDYHPDGRGVELSAQLAWGSQIISMLELKENA
ncbi:MAG: tRNA (adenosine(37)-N6)-threonylcarbamoyltransferase complex ATPase subunit type 1 TsaE [Gammaproteobacteria bacterium]|nr:tRNA (adenosine(37)-N6)-threonylcarbamoyltransferase complex ATPase subunit type 1 TsaE [Gammaproteobacteria bacterium]